MVWTEISTALIIIGLGFDLTGAILILKPDYPEESTPFGLFDEFFIMGEDAYKDSELLKRRVNQLGQDHLVERSIDGFGSLRMLLDKKSDAEIPRHPDVFLAFPRLSSNLRDFHLQFDPDSDVEIPDPLTSSDLEVIRTPVHTPKSTSNLENSAREILDKSANESLVCSPEYTICAIKGEITTLPDSSTTAFSSIWPRELSEEEYEERVEQMFNQTKSIKRKQRYILGNCEYIVPICEKDDIFDWALDWEDSTRKTFRKGALLLVIGFSLQIVANLIGLLLI